MTFKRRQINLILLIISLLMGGLCASLYWRSPSGLPFAAARAQRDANCRGAVSEITQTKSGSVDSVIASDMVKTPVVTSSDETFSGEVPAKAVFADAEPRAMVADHPFRLEAVKVLSGKLEETDSLSRHKILSYCEHLRTSYTTRDIDFIRQVFSDNALIIVGHVVKSAGKSVGVPSASDKVVYNVRSKHEYLEKLSRIFDSGKEVDVKFSEFRILRHPTVKGIYGVTLRQKYSSGKYADDGYLFLLWDFRNMSMPLIHVRTWQPSLSVDSDDEDDLIGISDFNLE